MESRRTSFFSRYRRLGPRKDEKYEEQSSAATTSSWPRNLHSHDDQDTTDEDDCTCLLDASYRRECCVSQRRYSTRDSLRSYRRASQILTVPPWCHLPSKRRFTVFTTHLLLILLLCTSSVNAKPVHHEHLRHIDKRQAIPDRFGNTGNEPGLVSLQPSPAATRPQNSQATTILAAPSSTVERLSSTVERFSSIVERLSSTIAPSPSTSTTIVSSLNTIPTSLSTFSPQPSTFLAPTSSPSPSASPSSTITPTPPGPENQLQRTEPMNPLSPATIAGIVVASTILLLLLMGIAYLIYRRKKAREVAEIPIRRSKLGSRLGLRMFGSHYDERIARSRSTSRGSGKYTERSMIPRDPAQNVVSEKAYIVLDDKQPIEKPPISPSIYSPRLTRAARLSTMTFGSVSGWLDKSTIGRPQPAYTPPSFTGTPSQLLDVPKPLFAKEQRRPDDAAPWAGKPDISPPRPARPGSAEPLGRLSGMGYGLGMGAGK